MSGKCSLGLHQLAVKYYVQNLYLCTFPSLMSFAAGKLMPLNVTLVANETFIHCCQKRFGKAFVVSSDWYDFLSSLWSPSSCPNVSSMFSVGVCQREKFGRGEQIASREKESEKARGWITALFLAHVPHECSACNGWPRVHLLIGVFKSSLVLPSPTRLPQAQIGPFKHLNVNWHSVLVFWTKKKSIKFQLNLQHYSNILL